MFALQAIRYKSARRFRRCRIRFCHVLTLFVYLSLLLGKAAQSRAGHPALLVEQSLLIDAAVAKTSACSAAVRIHQLLVVELLLVPCLGLRHRLLLNGLPALLAPACCRVRTFVADGAM